MNYQTIHVYQFQHQIIVFKKMVLFVHFVKINIILLKIRLIIIKHLVKMYKNMLLKIVMYIH